MTLPDPEVPLVYSLHYAQQGCQNWDNQLPPEAMGRIRNSKRGRATSMLRRIALRTCRA